MENKLYLAIIVIVGVIINAYTRNLGTIIILWFSVAMINDNQLSRNKLLEEIKHNQEIILENMGIKKGKNEDRPAN